MLALQFTKPIKQLLNAPADAEHAMMNAINYMDFANELMLDIANRFPYPSLWAAIDKLVEYEKKHVQAENEMYKNGYTYNDALVLRSYYEAVPPNE